MKVALAQISPWVGAFEENVNLILKSVDEASILGADLVITPEMSICGYPAHDLWEREDFVKGCQKALLNLIEQTKNYPNTGILVGHVLANPGRQGKSVFNQLSLIENGKILKSQSKMLLPTYDVFDEARYFEPGRHAEVFTWKGVKLGLAICEDLWADHDGFTQRSLYSTNPANDFCNQRADLIVSLSASPFDSKKSQTRLKVHQDVAKKVGAPLIYVNQVGATDEVVFDGGSFVIDQKGTLINLLPFFKSVVHVVDLDHLVPAKDISVPLEIELIYGALTTGIRDYFNKTGFKKAVLGLSGGIDSAVVAALAVDALGAGNVLGIAMPGMFSSGHSLEDAYQLAKNLSIRLENHPIKFQFTQYSRDLGGPRGGLKDIALENLQSRLRALILMTLSNQDDALVLTTGNKSEIAMGYCTLYGDMVGAMGPIADLYKTQVYELAHFINSKKSRIPERSISKAPSAELKPNQIDQDTLPPYEWLDKFLYDFIELGLNNKELESKYASDKDPKAKTWLKDSLKRFETSEYKRKQAAPGIRVSRKAFGMGRRVPITKKIQQGQ